MKNLNKNTLYFWLALLIFSTTSCKKFLDVAPKEFYQESDVLADVSQLEKELSILYNRIPVEYWTPSADPNYMLNSGSSDESFCNWTNVQAYLYNDGTWNAVSNPLGSWGNYESLRTAYHFLKYIDEVPVKDKMKEAEYLVLKPRYKLEAKYFIALYTFELFKRYGAVPVVDHYFSSDELTKMVPTPRNSTNEVVAFIVKNLDEIIPSLENTFSGIEVGRVTKGTAMALKAKVLLYAASPLFNGGEIDGVPVSVNGQLVKATLLATKGANGTALFNQQYDNEKWKKAADAARLIIDMGQYSLVPLQRSLFMGRNTTEVIFHKQMGFSTNFEMGTGPNGSDMGMWGGLGPTQDMIDSYEMKSGRFITDPHSGYKETGFKDTLVWVFRNRAWIKVTANYHNMYMNRDPRFYTDVFFNKMPYRHRNIITEYSNTTGLNNDGWGGKSGNSTVSGYYVQKWCDPEQNVLSSPKSIARNYPSYRYAEVLLWYAEAMNEYLSAPNAEVYDAINKVRDRVKMPPLPIADEDRTKAGMRKRIQNERKIELAFEGHRFWDIRRWLIAHTPELKKMTSLDYNSSGAAFYTRKAVKKDGRVFNINHYLMPIPADEILRANGAITQNYGW